MNKYVLLPLLFLSLVSFAQNPNWQMFANGNDINALEEVGTKIWIGTDIGVVVYDTVAGQREFINTASSELMSNQINCITAGLNGDVWLGVGDWDTSGVVKYNNGIFTTYTTGNSGLCHEDVRAICVEDDGTVWIGTYWGISRFRNNQWTTFNHMSGLPSPIINALDIDSAGNLWAGTYNGLGMYDGSTWTNYYTYNSGLPNSTINDIIFAPDGIMWIATEAGVASFDGTNFTTYNHSNSGIYDFVGCIDVAIDGSVWIGTGESSYGGGVYHFEGNEWVRYYTDNSGLPADVVPAILADSHNNFWAGAERIYYSDGGLVKYNGSDWISVNTSIAPLPYNYIADMAFTDSVTCWIGTLGSLTKYNGVNWQSYTTENSMLPGEVRNLVIDSLQRIWIATSGGLALFNGTTWHVYGTNNSGLPDNSIYDVTFDPNGVLWAGTKAGLAKYDGSTWTSYTIENSGLPDPTIRSIMADPLGNIWMFSHLGESGNRSLSKFDGTDWTTWNRDNSTFGMAMVYEIVYGPDGNIWMPEAGEGLVQFNGTDFIAFNTENSGISSDWLLSLNIDDDGHFWIGSYDEGLMEWDGSETWINYSVSNSPIVNNGVNKIIIDSNNTKWIGTQNGLSLYNEVGIPVDTKETGTPSNQFLLYPNPANDIIILNIPKTTVLSIQIIDINGSVVGHYKSCSEINISNLATGIYCLRMMTTDGRISASKFIKR